MSRWRVSVPVAGEVYVEVDAGSEEEAIELGMELAGEILRGEADEDVDGEIAELEAYEQLCEDHVFHGPASRATAEEV